MILFSLSLTFLIALIILKKGNNVNHIETFYQLESTIIEVDRFTIHNLIFKNDKILRNITFKYNREKNNYILTVDHYSKEHKNKLMKILKK